MFLYVQEGKVEEVMAMLRPVFAGTADVVNTQDLLAEGFFGPGPVSDAFLQHLGDVVILPYKHETAWWYVENKFSMPHRGHHGGLTKEEVEIPLLMLEL